jgi:hypothetical protein
MLKRFAILSICAVLSVSASAQQASYPTNNPAPVKGDPDKVVCERQEEIGSRISANRVCKTVREWNEDKMANREATERIQAGAWTRSGSDPGAASKGTPSQALGGIWGCC